MKVDILLNVVLIVIDDMGWNDVSYYGSEICIFIMDRLVKEGVEFNCFYVYLVCLFIWSVFMIGKVVVCLGFVNFLGKNNVKGLFLFEIIML